MSAPIRTPRERFVDYWSRINLFADTAKGRAIRDEHGWSAMAFAATGLSDDEAIAMCDEYYAWNRANSTHESARAKFHGPQRCGYCGGEFESIDRLLSHESFCSFNPERRAPAIRIGVVD